MSPTLMLTSAPSQIMPLPGMGSTVRLNASWHCSVPAALAPPTAALTQVQSQTLPRPTPSGPSQEPSPRPPQAASVRQALLAPSVQKPSQPESTTLAAPPQNAEHEVRQAPWLAQAPMLRLPSMSTPRTLPPLQSISPVGQVPEIAGLTQA